MAESSYSQFLKSSLLIGGAQGFNLLLGMVRVKFAAVLIGPIGVGLLGNYLTIQILVGTITGLGIHASGVRDVAAAVGQADPQAIGRTVLTLRRVCWLTGLLGVLALAALSPLLSRWTFGSDEYIVEIALLGLGVLLGNVTSGQTALIQGLRRISDLAQLRVIGACAETAISIGFYLWLGLRGIVPALLLINAVQLIVSWYFAQRVKVSAVVMSWWESFRMAGGLVRLGLVLMWDALGKILVAYLTRVLITQQISLEAVGIFGAAYNLSGIFVNFVLEALWTDYYPRLTALRADRSALNRLVNEQTEIGLLLAVPGLLSTLALAPWIIQIIYTKAFLPAIDLLQWFTVGSLWQIVSWPLGYVMLSLGKGAWFFVTQTLMNILLLGLNGVGLWTLGLEGVALAFFILNLIYTAAVYGVARYLTGFTWSTASRQLLLRLSLIVAVTFIATRWLPLWPATIFGFVVSGTVSVLCLRELVKRIGAEHRIVRAACQIPGMRLVCGLSR